MDSLCLSVILEEAAGPVVEGRDVRIAHIARPGKQGLPNSNQIYDLLPSH